MSKEAAISMLTGESAPVTAPAPEVTAPVSTETAQLDSTRFNQFAKKEADIVRMRQEVSAQKKELVQAAKEYQAFQEKKKTDPIAAMKMLGFSEADIFNYMAEQAPVEISAEEKAIKAAADAADARIKAFEDAQEKKLKDSQLESDKQAITTFQNEIARTMESNKDKFEYCAYFGEEAKGLAYKLTEEVFRTSKGQEVLSPMEAIAMAEDYFEEQDKAMSAIRKRQPKVEAPAAPAEVQRSRAVTPGFPNETQVQPKPVITHNRTLTNAATSTLASSRYTRNETKDQKRERLMQALRNGSL